MNKRFILLALALASAASALADFNPVPLTPGSFTQDIVVEKSGQPPLQNYCTATIDNGTNVTGYTYFEQGYIPGWPWQGVPAHGTTFNSLIAGHSYMMPPDYTTNNAGFIGSRNAAGTSTLVVEVPSVTLTAVNPAAYSAVSVLYGAGSGGPINVGVTHADGTTESFSFTCLDWFNTTAPAWYTDNRVSVDGGLTAGSGNTTGSRLFSSDFTLSDTGSPVTSLTFSLGSTTTSYVCAIMAVSGSTDGVTYTSPIALSGFNQQVIIPVGAPVGTGGVGSFGTQPPPTTVTMDQGPANGGNTWFEQGLNGGTGTNGSPTTISGGKLCGVPHAGATVTAGVYTYQMPASYQQNHCVFIGNYAASNAPTSNGNVQSPAYQTGSFTFNSPQPLQALSFLGSAGNGPCVMSYTVSYDDGNTQTGSMSVLDWFNTTGVISAAGRVTVPGRAINNLGTTATSLYANNITLSETSASVTNVSFTWTSGGRVGFLAVSGQAIGGSTYTPLAVSGWNARIVVPASTPWWTGPINASTATMDGGTNNNGNTWFERGWVTNGAVAASGLPPAGSTITALTSTAGNNHYYQFASSWQGPNSVLIDVNHKVANITPATPANYGAFSLLTAGANIGSGGNVMSNYCLLQHADGTTESNLFYAYDWFNTTATLPTAYIANGRASTASGNAVSDFANPQVPRLFESFFAVTNANSPVTNIVVGYGLAGGATWTTYIMAVSAGAGLPPAAPTLLPNPASVFSFEGTSNYFACGLSGGTKPITYQWYFTSTNGTGGALSNGGQISGANSLVLGINGCGFTNIGSYYLVANNAIGTTTSGVATLTLLSGYTNVAQVADESDIAIYNGSSPAAETCIHAIDRLVGVDPGKYLNFGLNGGAPFAGPAGFTISPVLGSSIIKGLRFYTANDAEERDPSTYMLEGSNDGGSTWTTVIANGSVALPVARNAQSPSVAMNPLTQNMAESLFYANTAAFTTYRLSILSVKNNQAGVAVTANSTQFGEVEMLGVPNPIPPVFTLQPASGVTVYAGGDPAFHSHATGYGSVGYQWYTNGTPVTGATGPNLTIWGVGSGLNGATFTCVATNVYGATTSTPSLLTLIAAPTTPLATAIIADKPVGYWRLDEGPDDGAGNQGVIAHDYEGGYNGMYTNTILGVSGYAPAVDPDTAAQFGQVLATDSAVENITGLTFAAGAGTNSAFTIEAWVNPIETVTVAGAGLVTSGYGGGGEQFALDCGGPNNTVRFYYHDASGAIHTVTAASVLPNGMNPNTWYHLVAVVDEFHTNQVLYVNGLPVATNNLASLGLGVLTANLPMSIGSRTANATSDYSMQFIGTIDDVAVYNYALTSTQVLTHYFGSEPAPAFIVSPTNTTVSEGGNATFYSLAYGPGTLSYQWYVSDLATYTNALTGQTGHNLVLSHVTTAQNGNYYVIEVAGSTGTAIAAAQLTVSQGPPVVESPLGPIIINAMPGGLVSLEATFGGTLPITYQWQSSPDGSTWANLPNGGRISGATSNVLTIADVQTSDGPYFQLNGLNSFSGGSPTTTPSYQVVLGPASINFETNGYFWTVQNSGGVLTPIGNNVLTLTTDTGGSAHSAFFNQPIYIGNFLATFVFQDVTIGGADGAAFVLQNDPRGPAALGGGGGSLGYAGITPSAALEFNVYTGNAVGVAVDVNGVTGAGGLNGGYTQTSPVNVAGGDPILVAVRYANGMATITLTDTNTTPASTWTTNVAVNLPAILGADTAYVGFTGADGGAAATLTVTGFNYYTYPQLYVQQAGANVVFSWLPEVGNFSLLENSSLTSGTWAPVAQQPSYVNGWYQVVVPTSSAATGFFRLAGQP